MEGEERLGEMVIGIAGNDLTVYHTEVFPPAKEKRHRKETAGGNG